MSRERAQRRATREQQRRVADEARRRRALADQRRRRRRDRVLAPGRRVGQTAARTWRRFAARSRLQRAVLAGAAAVVVVGVVGASSWGQRVLVVGFTALLLPVALTLTAPRRRPRRR